MKYCTKCGAQCEDNAIFCVKCGTKFELPEPSEQNETTPTSPPQIILPQTPQYAQPPPQYQQPPPQYAQPPYGGYVPPLPETPATGILKKISSSPLFVVFVLLYSLLLVIRLIKVFTDNIATAPYLYGIPGGGTPIVNGWAIAAGLIGWILPALIGLGLWMHFMAANDKRNEGMKTSGLTLIMVCTIITLVLVSIAILLLLLSLLIMLIAVLSAGIPAVVAGVAVMCGIYVIGVILVIIYYVKVLKSIRAVSRCAKTGNPHKVSAYVAVVNFILAFFGILGIIVQIVAYSWINSWIIEFLGDFLDQIYRQVGSEVGDAIAQMMSVVVGSIFGVDIWVIALSALNAAVLIFISAAMLSYNSKIKKLNYFQIPQAPPSPYTQNTPPPGF